MLQSKKLKVLVVDDNVDNSLELENILEQMKITTLKATSESALRHLLNNDVFLILIDASVSRTNGFKTAEFIRKDENFKRIPIIITLSMENNYGYAFEGYESGAVDYIFKPVNPMIFESKIKVFIDIFEKNNLLENKKYLLEKTAEELVNLREFNYKLEKLSFYDSLTGINNRRRFDETLSKEWNRALRNQAELSIIMIDVDNFKSYNDNYGHQSGDKCLKRVADVLHYTVKRATDLVARYGGEEFTVLLPNTDNYGAMEVAERIRKNIEALNIKHEYSNTSDCLTVSLGVSSVVPTPSKYKDELLERADLALYRAKDNHKNTVCNSKIM